MHSSTLVTDHLLKEKARDGNRVRGRADTRVDIREISHMCRVLQVKIDTVPARLEVDLRS